MLLLALGVLVVTVPRLECGCAAPSIAEGACGCTNHGEHCCCGDGDVGSRVSDEESCGSRHPVGCPNRVAIALLSMDSVSASVPSPFASVALLIPDGAELQHEGTSDLFAFGWVVREPVPRSPPSLSTSSLRL